MATLTTGEKARMYALGKIMRGGASRGGYVGSQVFITIDGVPVGWGATPHRVLLDTLTITDELDDTPNTCGFRLNGLVPAAGAEVIITRGSKNAARLYAGFALTVQQLYVGDKPANVQADVRCVDYTWQFGFLTVTKQYRFMSASVIAYDLVTTYAAANGFTSGAVANLPALDEITFTNEPLDTALTRLARRIGGYWFVDYQKVVHLFLDAEDPTQAPEVLTPAHKSLRAFQNSADRTQVLTRAYVEGRGTNALATVGPGATMIPVAASDMFAVGPDVFVKVSPQGSSGGAQHLTFTGVSSGGAGALVGSGTAPSSGLGLTPTSGGAVTPGLHVYCYTWVSASGETLNSPGSNVTITSSAPTAVAPTVAVGAGPGLPAGTYTYGVTHVTASGETAVAGNVAAVCTFATAAGTAAPQVVGGSGTTTLGTAGDHVQFRIAYRYVGLSTPATLGPATSYTLVQYAGAATGTAAGVQVRIWGVTDTGGATCCDIQMQNTTAGGGWRTQLSGVAIPVSPNSVVQPFGNGAFAPAVVETGLGTAAVTVTVNDASADVTKRRVYRTPVNGSQKYFLKEVAGSAQTSFVDTTADGALVTPAPAGLGALQSVTVSGIALGPKGTGGGPATTARKLYRTLNDAATWKFLATIADNTTTTYVDTAADGALTGTGPPVTDTSGLVADGGQVLAGAPTIPVSGTGAFPPTGGWVLAGNNRIRYASVTGATLAGVPVSGDGAILNTIPFGTPITLAPMLTGLGGITAPIVAGDEVYLVVKADDTARQSTVAAMVKSGPGVREEWVQDRRLSITEARNRAQATLALRPLEDVTITYVCRDVRTASGKTITVNLPAPTNVFGAFKIQSVTINNFRPYPNQLPTYTVTASSRRFNFEDWLRRIETSV
jgi:hypothetical protein